MWLSKDTLYKQLGGDFLFIVANKLDKLRRSICPSTAHNSTPDLADGHETHPKAIHNQNVWFILQSFDNQCIYILAEDLL